MQLTREGLPGDPSVGSGNAPDPAGHGCTERHVHICGHVRVRQAKGHSGLRRGLGPRRESRAPCSPFVLSCCWMSPATHPPCVSINSSRSVCPLPSGSADAHGAGLCSPPTWWPTSFPCGVCQRCPPSVRGVPSHLSGALAWLATRGSQQS